MYLTGESIFCSIYMLSGGAVEHSRPYLPGFPELENK